MSPSFTTGYVSRMLSHNVSWAVLAVPADSQGPVFGYAAYNGLLSAVDSGQVGAVSKLCIMQGTKPANFTNLQTTDQQASNVLVSFGETTPSNTFSIHQSENVATISTRYNNASVSGVATWFWLFTTRYNSYNSGASVDISNQLMGTVGLPGTGSDLELQDTNIIAGQPYRVLNLGLRFPTSWTF